MKMTIVEAPPKASILIESMRDIGYTLETALADVIDNSIASGATIIDIHVDTISPQMRIAVIDNGCGMTKAQLLDAMRLGSRHPREARQSTDLGRFGLGLKTASLSQCRRLTVAARKDGQTSVATWDLDHVQRHDSWSLIMSAPATVPLIDRLGPEGVLVLWEKLDRAVEQDGSESARKHFVKRVDEARAHLELVFHRFLRGELGVQKVQIRLNNTLLKPFDPFNSGHSATIHGQPELIRTAAGTVKLKTYTLPHHAKVSRSEWEYYAGPGGYLRNQGFYLYRERRLIVHGTWFGLARQTEMTKLTRVQVDIANSQDDEWNIDVKKASARPPLQVRSRLQALIASIGAPSKKVYQRRGQRLHDARIPVWERIQTDGNITYRLNLQHPLLSGLSDDLAPDVSRRFGEFCEIVSSALPMDAIFADLAGEPECVVAQQLSDEALSHLLDVTLTALVAAGASPETVPSILRNLEPFRSHQDRVDELLNHWDARGER